MAIEWDIIGRHRVDIVVWSKADMVARKRTVQFFPGGRQGDLVASDVASMVIRAPLGTRITLMTAPGARWWTRPWRCIRFIEGHVVPSSRRTGLPGVRVPDLDRLDPVDARKTDRQLESSYPLVEVPSQGTWWTFGAVGGTPLKGHVRGIRIEHDEAVHNREPASPTPLASRPSPSPMPPAPAPAPKVSDLPPEVPSPPRRHRVVPVDFGSPMELAEALDDVVLTGETVVDLLPRPRAGARDQVWVVLRQPDPA